MIQGDQMTNQKSKSKPHWRQDPETVKADILEIATSVFAEHGFAGARIDEIVGRTKTSKRMIYYYFGNKDQLYLRVLEEAYLKLRNAERQLTLDELAPMDAIEQLIDFSFEYHHNHPEYVRLIASENIRNGSHINQSDTIPDLSNQIISHLHRICRSGIDQGLFRPDINAVELHWMISAFCVFNVSNAATFSHLHGDALFTDNGQASLKEMIKSTIAKAVAANPTSLE